MPYQKTEPVYRDKAKTIKEPGIWRLTDGKYLAEVNYTDPHTGKRIRERKTTNRLDLAREWIQIRKADALRGEIRGGKKKHKPVLFDKFADEYFETWSQKRKASTVLSERSRVKTTLKSYFGSKPIHTITRKEIETFIAKRREDGKTVASTNRELCRLRNMFSVAVGWGYLESSPVEGLKQAREQVKEADFLSKEEVTKLLAVCDERIRPLLLTAVYTGMRWGELMKLEWRDIDFERGFMTIRDPKNSETRYVPMNPAVREALETHRKAQAQQAGGIVSTVFQNPETGKPWVNIRKPFSKALKHAKIKRHIRFHDLRHTAASHLIMAGVDLRTVGKILGHKDLKMTLRYAHLAPEYLKGAVDRLNFGP